MKTVNHFRKKLHLRYLSGFWICLWVGMQQKFFQKCFAIIKENGFDNIRKPPEFLTKIQWSLFYCEKNPTCICEIIIFCTEPGFASPNFLLEYLPFLKLKATYFLVCKLSLSSSFLGKLFRKVIVESFLRRSSRSNLKIRQKINLHIFSKLLGNYHAH